MIRCYIGLGSNLAGPADRIRSALDALGRIPDSRLLDHSALYRSPPMGPPGQPDYVNAVAALETGLAPEALLDALQGIEAAHDRRRDGERWGPRTLDLDLLLYGDRTVATARLTVPHPGVAERAFVLVPLCELAPGLTLPDGRGVCALAAGVAADDLAVLTPPGEGGRGILSASHGTDGTE